MVSNTILHNITKRLVDGFDPEKIIFFGSVSRGRAEYVGDVVLAAMAKEGINLKDN